MIDFSNVKEKDLLLKFANKLNDSSSVQIVETGVNSVSDTEQLAKLYWAIVDMTQGEDIEYLLEKTYTSLHIHCSNRGYLETWDNCIP